MPKIKQPKYLGSCWTNGRGYWSTSKRYVPITKLELVCRSLHGDSHYYAELRVYFDQEYWQVSAGTDSGAGLDGLIYSDPQWIKEFRLLLKAHGFSYAAAENVDYSEKGMQGVNYVSLDAGRTFIFECTEPLLKFLKKNKKGIVKVIYD